jgi:PAS domain S-box-containing protein
MIEKSNRQYLEEIKSLRRQMAYFDQLKSEYLQTIETLTENEKLYRDLAENDPDCTFWLNADDRLVYISPSCRRITGYEPEDFKKDAKLLYKIIHPDDRPVFDEHLRLAHKSKSPLEGEFRISGKDKKARWISHISQPVYDAEGQYTGILASSRDITDSKNKDDVSQESGNRYRLLSENMNDVIWTMDMAFQLTYISPSVLQLRGYTVEEAVEQNLRDALTSMSFQKFNEAWSAQMAQEHAGKTIRNRSLTLQLECLCKDGSTVWTESRITPLRNEDKKIVEILGVSRNIAEIKQTQESLIAGERKLRQSENQLKAILNASTESIFLMNVDGHVLFANDTAAHHLGTDLETLLKKGDINDFIPPETGVKRRQHMLQAQKTNKPVQFQDELMGRTIANTIYPVVGEDGKVAQMAVFGLDITDRKSAESVAEKSRQKLAEAERLLNLIIDATPARVYWKDKRSVYLGCNHLFAQDAERDKPEDLIGDVDQNMVWREQADRIREDDLAVMNDGQSKINCEELQTTPDGKQIWLSTTKIPLTDADGRTIGVIGTYEDITLQKRAEDKLIASEKQSRQNENQLQALLNEQKKVKEELIAGEKQMCQSENQLRALLDAATESIFLMDTDGKVLYATEMTAQRLGTDLPTLLAGRSMFDFLPPEVAEKRRKYIADVQKTARPARFEDERLGRTILNSLYPIVGKDGKVAKLAAVGMDITEQKTTVENLAESEKSYKSLFENNHMAMLLIDPESGAIVNANAAASAYYGWSREELIRKNISDINTLSAREIAKQMNLALTQKRNHFIFKHRRADGSIRDVEVFSGLLQFHSKSFLYTTIYDITDRLQMEQTLRQSEKLDSLGILAGGIAHDFNNLMTIVQGRIDVALLTLPEDDVARQSLEAAQDTVEKTRDITSRLITLSRSGAPIVTVCRIENLLCESAKSSLKSSPVVLSLAIQDGLWPVEVDQSQIKQCFSHLVDNAREAMPDGGNLTIRAENIDITDADALPLAEGPYLRITFEDNGAGIAGKHIARIFDPYYTTKPLGKDRGMGLGLAVCHSVLKKHGGYITVNSEEGRGATFSLYLPAKPGFVVEEEPPAIECTLSPRRILIMDDNDDIRKILQIYMEKLGFEATGVKEGQEAIRKYKEAQEADDAFSAVFMELSVKQGLGGLAALTRLKNIDPDIKAVAILSEDSDSRIHNLLEQGFQDVLGKPFRLENMKKILKNILES